MITRQEFENGANAVRNDFTSALTTMINFKRSIQTAVILIATEQELQDVRDCRINNGLINKLVTLAKEAMPLPYDAKQLYCAAMAVGTIIKEYDWGNQYLTANGLYELATAIYNA